MSNYQKGRRVEYEVAQVFKNAGWTVTRAASSKGPFDLIATKITVENEKKVYFVVLMQVKSEKLPSTQ